MDDKEYDEFTRGKNHPAHMKKEPEGGTTVENNRDLVDDNAPKQGLPVAGYKPTQSVEAIAAVNVFKELEERVLRHIDTLSSANTRDDPFVNPRLLAIGRTQLQGAFMFLARAIFQPQRVVLPEDFKQCDGYDTLNVRKCDSQPGDGLSKDFDQENNARVG